MGLAFDQNVRDIYSLRILGEVCTSVLSFSHNFMYRFDLFHLLSIEKQHIKQMKAQFSRVIDYMIVS